MVARAIVDLTIPNVPIRLMNISDFPRSIKKGTVVASCVPVTSIHRVKCPEDYVTISRGSVIQGGNEHDKNVRQDPAMEELYKNSSSNLLPHQEIELKKLLSSFKDVFCLLPNQHGRTNVITHKIDTGDTQPIRQHHRRIPVHRRGEVDGLLEEMQSLDAIEASESPWASPIVLAKKKDGSTRFCVDYRRLNAVTKKDSYPLPRIDDTLDTLSGSEWFTTLDLKLGYWQVEMHPESREKTAFTTGQGLWQFKVMPFGLCNAPATFERLMETVLRGLTLEACLVYLDDIIVVGKDFNSHLHNLSKVLERLQNSGLKLNPKKCRLFQKEVTFLGHVISENGVRTDPIKIDAVKNWPRPSDTHQIRSFLGLCTYYRRFVFGFSTIAKPLHRLTEAKNPFVWTPECEIAFLKLKKCLLSAPILAYPQPDLPFILDTDASNCGIGAVLSQLQDGEERVIAYFSKVLSKPERNYCVTRRELLAIVKAVQHFHHYLYGQEFQLRTDHAALRWLMNFKNPEGQIARWLQHLQEFQFTIHHRKGILHGNADAMSRRPCEESCKTCARAETTFCPEIPIRPACVQMNQDGNLLNDCLETDQELDDELKPIVKWKKSGIDRPSWQDVAQYSPGTKRYWALWDSLAMKDGLLCHRWENNDGTTSNMQIVIPRKHIEFILREIHDNAAGGHFGIQKTFDKVRERYFWLHCRKDVQQWCSQCDPCASKKGPKKRSRGRLQLYNVGAPFERIAYDIAGPFPRTKNDNRYILVIMDYFTKWPEIIALPNQEAITVAGALVNTWISRYGVPLQIHSDQGRNFEATVTKETLKLLGVEKTRTTALHPQSDGMVERFNRTITQHISLFVAQNQLDWDEHLQIFSLAYRSAVHQTTGMTPSELLYGRCLRLPVDLVYGRPHPPSHHVDYVKDLEKKLETVHQFARDRIKLETDRMKTRYDCSSNEIKFGEKDLVWLFNPKRKKGLSPKLQRNWEGPYEVVNKINDVVYRVRKSPKAACKVIHVDRLAPYHGKQKV